MDEVASWKISNELVCECETLSQSTDRPSDKSPNDAHSEMSAADTQDSNLDIAKRHSGDHSGTSVREVLSLDEQSSDKRGSSKGLSLDEQRSDERGSSKGSAKQGPSNPRLSLSMPNLKDCSSFVCSHPQNTAMQSVVKELADSYGVDGCVITLHCFGAFQFYASHGLAASVQPPKPTEGFQFFCHHIRRNLPIIILDALKHSDAKKEKLVTEEQQVRFYVGAPLIYGSGTYLGTISILDKNPRQQFFLEDCIVLEQKAAEVVTMIKDHEHTHAL